MTFGALLTVVAVMTAGLSVGAAPYGYVPTDTGHVWVFDARTSLPVSPSLNLGPGGLCGAVADPSGARVYVGSCSGPVHVIDASTNTVVTTLPASAGVCRPTGMAIHPNGSALYLDSGSAISLDTGTILGQFAAGCGLAIDPSGAFLYVNISSAIAIIDTATLHLVGSIQIPGTCAGPGQQPGVPITGCVKNLAMSPTGQFLYATHAFDAGLSVIDVVAKTVVTTLSLGTDGIGHSGLGAVVVSPGGRRVYASGFGADGGVGGTGGIVVIDAVARSIVTVIDGPRYIFGFPVPGIPASILALNAAGTKLYAALEYNEVRTIDATTNIPEGGVTLYLCPREIFCGTPHAPRGFVISGPTPPLDVAIVPANTDVTVHSQIVAVLGVSNLGLPESADFYLGVLKPNGEILFMDMTFSIVTGNIADIGGIRPVASNVALDSPFEFLNFSTPLNTRDFEPTDPEGTYTLFLLAVKAGAPLSGDLGDNVLALSTATFEFLATSEGGPQ